MDELASGQAAVDALVRLLDLEALGDDRFLGISPPVGPQRVFGGQVAGQALVAAGRTVDPQRQVHSLHGYFVRPGDPTEPITYAVENIRDGRSFSVRRSVAQQHGEVIFFIDRLGSMAGSKINSLRDALGVFLKSLPSTCSFNLVSFGDRHSSLWPSSKPYGPATLDVALSHAASLNGDMGGTQLLPVLKAVVQRRNKELASTQVIVLTDGEIWEAHNSCPC